MKTTKLKNKFNKKTGQFICGGMSDKGCGKDAGIGIVIRGYVYCIKCAKKLKGVNNGWEFKDSRITK